jgi:beta-lactamase superfamily II metal-dependent hydrolase
MLLPLTRCGWLVAGLVAASLVASAQGPGAGPRTLDIYWIDVEGGAATLVVSPSGESLLYDAGWEVDGRDAKRIAAVVRVAGLSRIDTFVLSHFHADHAGGLQALAKLVPVGRCFDRGDFIEPANQRWRDAYLSVCGSHRTILKANDRIPMKDVRIDVVASNGTILTKPMSGVGSKTNTICATAENHPPDVPENQLMVGAMFTYGSFRFLDLADLDWEKEIALVCPVNKLGQVSIWQAGRHGALDGAGAPGFLSSITPRVVVVNNGPRKGLGGPSPNRERAASVHYQRIAKTSGVEAVWQGHRSLLQPAADANTSEQMIANLEETADQGHWIRASVQRDGTFTVTNSRNGFSQTYRSR